MNKSPVPIYSASGMPPRQNLTTQSAYPGTNYSQSEFNNAKFGNPEATDQPFRSKDKSAEAIKATWNSRSHLSSFHPPEGLEPLLDSIANEKKIQKNWRQIARKLFVKEIFIREIEDTYQYAPYEQAIKVLHLWAENMPINTADRSLYLCFQSLQYFEICDKYFCHTNQGCIQRKTIKSIDCTNSEDIEKSSYRPLLEGSTKIEKFFREVHFLDSIRQCQIDRVAADLRDEGVIDAGQMSSIQTGDPRKDADFLYGILDRDKSFIKLAVLAKVLYKDKVTNNHKCLSLTVHDFLLPEIERMVTTLCQASEAADVAKHISTLKGSLDTMDSEGIERTLKDHLTSDGKALLTSLEDILEFLHAAEKYAPKTPESSQVASSAAEIKSKHTDDSIVNSTYQNVSAESVDYLKGFTEDEENLQEPSQSEIDGASSHAVSLQFKQCRIQLKELFTMSKAIARIRYMVQDAEYIEGTCFFSRKVSGDTTVFYLLTCCCNILSISLEEFRMKEEGDRRRILCSNLSKVTIVIPESQDYSDEGARPPIELTVFELFSDKPSVHHDVSDGVDLLAVECTCDPLQKWRVTLLDLLPVKEVPKRGEVVSMIHCAKRNGIESVEYSVGSIADDQVMSVPLLCYHVDASPESCGGPVLHITETCERGKSESTRNVQVIGVHSSSVFSTPRGAILQHFQLFKQFIKVL